MDTLMSEVRNVIWQDTDEAQCRTCNKPFRPWKWVYGTAVYPQLHCDQCVYAENERNNRDKNRHRRTWHITQGWVTEKVFRDNWGNSDPAKEQGAHQSAKSWDTERNMFVYGRRGTGKTYLARACLNTAFEEGKSIAEIKAVDFIALLSASRGNDSIRFLRSPGVLLFDDIDKGEFKGWSFQHVYDLLDKRCEAGKTTIMTSNAKLAELIPKLADDIKNIGTINATFDRMMPVDVYELTGDSLRKGV